ncbi:hypothetical protein IJM86_01315 [bacterium]|nr:hypothetical protein [bacterium]
MKDQDITTEEVLDKYGKITDEYSEESAQIILKAEADGIQRDSSYYAMIVPIDVYDNE